MAPGSMLLAITGGLTLGVLSSWHCAGMCGPFPIHLSKAEGRGHPFARLSLCMLGKAFTYAFLGALVGFAGEAITKATTMKGAQTWMAYGIGAAMVLFGIAMISSRAPAIANKLMPESGGLLSGVYRHFFNSPGPWTGFTLGLFMGFLPCPATLAALLLAASLQSLPAAIASMFAFGLGTAPILIGMGMGASFIMPKLRTVGLYASGGLVVLMGIMTIMRGSACPFCKATEIAKGALGGEAAEAAPEPGAETLPACCAGEGEADEGLPACCAGEGEETPEPAVDAGEVPACCAEESGTEASDEP
ncbi:MAG: hypothetical protein GF320_02870 [Armatimonadia bacterium]|nr:hypothetical protein [Armatimonadia bacterium]